MGNTAQFVKKKASTASWKTSLAGIGSIAGGIAALCKMLQDKDMNYEHLVVAVGLISAGFSGLFARDNNKTSEDVGAETKPKVTVVPETPKP